MEDLIEALAGLPPDAIREACSIVKKRLQQGFLDQCSNYRNEHKITPHTLIMSYQTSMMTIDTIRLAANAMDNRS